MTGKEYLYCCSVCACRPRPDVDVIGADIVRSAVFGPQAPAFGRKKNDLTLLFTLMLVRLYFNTLVRADRASGARKTHIPPYCVSSSTF